MKYYSEKTTRELDRYMRKLVKKMPPWVEKLFASEKIMLTVEEDGEFTISCVEELPEQERMDAARLIFTYLDTVPCKAFKVMEVQ